MLKIDRHGNVTGTQEELRRLYDTGECEFITYVDGTKEIVSVRLWPIWTQPKSVREETLRQLAALMRAVNEAVGV